MKDTPKHSFEDEFRKAFEDAEATPSPKLWAQIDAELANKEAGVYKRKLYIYKLRVAAAAVLAFGFLGIWLLNSQFSGNTLADLPQQTNSQQSNNPASNNMANVDKPVSNKAGNSALAEQQAHSQKETTLESAATKSANSDLLVNENVRGAQERSFGKTPKQNTASKIPQTKVLEANKEKTGNATDKTTLEEEKATISSKPATSSNKNREIIIKHEPAIARTTPARNDLPLAEKADNSALLSGNATTGNNNPVETSVLSNEKKSIYTDLTVSKFSAYAFNRINQSVQPLDNRITLQAPRIAVKPNPHVWIEEKEIEGGQVASRWDVGLSFVPSQFNPNMQVHPQASASLSNARNNYYYYNRNAAPVSTGNTLQHNTNVGKELEQAQNVNLSYNVGVDVGYALSEKFSLHSGLLYLHNNSQITTDNYLQNISNQEKYPEFMALIQPSVTNQNSFLYSNTPAPINAPMADAIQHIELAIANKYATSYPGVTEVLVYNTYQYLSIPLSVHYKLLDKKVSTDIGAGVSADIFMKNTIGNPEENITNHEFTRSDNGPYRDMSFSGLVSAKVNYKISSKYSVYVQPSYRTALNSITNSALVNSKPNSFGIGTGFQYRF